jgi:hypothetical protein
LQHLHDIVQRRFSPPPPHSLRRLEMPALVRKVAV